MCGYLETKSGGILSGNWVKVDDRGQERRSENHCGGSTIIIPANKYTNTVMRDLIRHPVPTWIPAFAGMTIL